MPGDYFSRGPLFFGRCYTVPLSRCSSRVLTPERPKQVPARGLSDHDRRRTFCGLQPTASSPSADATPRRVSQLVRGGMVSDQRKGPIQMTSRERLPDTHGSPGLCPNELRKSQIFAGLSRKILQKPHGAGGALHRAIESRGVAGRLSRSNGAVVDSHAAATSPPERHAVDVRFHKVLLAADKLCALGHKLA